MYKIQLRLVEVPDGQPNSPNYHLLRVNEFPLHSGMQKRDFENAQDAIQAAQSVIESVLDANTPSNYQPNFTPQESAMIDRWVQFELGGMRPEDLRELICSMVGVRQLAKIAHNHDEYRMGERNEPKR